MSNNLIAVVPVLDGSNWSLWSQQMKVYLMSQGLWGHCDGTIIMPDPVVTTYKDGSTSEDTSARDAWRLNDTKTIGTIRLRCSPAVATLIQDKTTAIETWKELSFTYGISSLASIYNELRGALTTRIPADQHPAPAFAKITKHFNALASENQTIPNCLQGLICLNALPPRYDSLGAHKISAVKRKPGDPSFSSQQQQRPQGSSSNARDGKKRPYRGKRAGKKRQGQNHDHHHAHDV
ncbi:hypothetical protein GLOTRDRAFT_51241, partial [Gloeophyllum trabeum ATCC 11539]